MSPKTAEPVTSFVSAVAREERSAAGSSMSLSGRAVVPRAVNEPVRTYAPGSPERAELKARLASMSTERVDIPIVVDGERIRTGQTDHAVMPHDHKHILGDWHKAERKKSRMRTAPAGGSTTQSRRPRLRPAAHRDIICLRTNLSPETGPISIGRRQLISERSNLRMGDVAKSERRLRAQTAHMRTLAPSGSVEPKHWYLTCTRIHALH